MSNTIGRLADAGILSVVVVDGELDNLGYQPAVDPMRLSVEYVLQTLNKQGYRGFIPSFKEHFPGVIAIADSVMDCISEKTKSVLLKDLAIEENISTLH